MYLQIKVREVILHKKRAKSVIVNILNQIALDWFR